jgi:uncharacterized protein (TIGR00297 family)
MSYHYEIDYTFLTTIIFVLAPAGFLLFHFKILTRRGSFVAFLLGFYFAGITGCMWLISVLLFFLSSVAFTKLQHAINGIKNNTEARNAWQVIANIIWAVISSALFLLTQNEIFILFFIAFVATVTADTWASEIGPLLNKKCFSLSEMRLVAAGTNGGISFFGSLVALIGASVIASISYYLFFDSWNWHTITILSISAFIACFADSLLGTFVEKRMHQMNYFKKQKTVESISPNDLVNLFGSFTAFIFFILLSWIF